MSSTKANKSNISTSTNSTTNSSTTNSSTTNSSTTNSSTTNSTHLDYSDSESDYDDEIDYETYTGSTKNRVIRNNDNYYRGPVGKVRMGKGK